MTRFVAVGFQAAVVVACMAPVRMAPVRMAAQDLDPSPGDRLKPAAAAAMVKVAAAKPTPRGADGHPDLNGYWNFPEYGKAAHLGSNGTIYIDVPPANGGTLIKLDATLEGQLRHLVDPNPPPYKRELLKKVRELAHDGVHTDPAFRCRPLGVPRAGPPRQIVQTPKLIVIFYQVDSGEGDQPGNFRLVPTDGRPHRTDVDPSYFGDSIGHWDGDTLVIDVAHLNDDTWLASIPGQGGSGYFHTEALHVVERIARIGDSLRWEATAEDRNVLAKPWVMTPQYEVLTEGMIYEQPLCEERETPHIVNKY